MPSSGDLQLALEQYDFFAEQSAARSVGEIQAAAKVILKEALDTAIFFQPLDKSGNPVKTTKVLPMDACLKPQKYSKTPNRLKDDELMQVIAAFSVRFGAVTKTRFYMGLKAGGYVGFPVLLENGNRGAAQWALAKQMKSLIEAGKVSNILDFLTKAGISVKTELKGFMFAKGHSLAKTKDNALLIKEDVQTVIEAMKQSAGTKLQIINESQLKFIVAPIV